MMLNKERTFSLKNLDLTQTFSTNKDLFKETNRFINQQVTPTTKKLYHSDWKIFTKWCQKQNITSEKARPEAVAVFLVDQFCEGKHPSTLGRRVAAIKFAFRCRNLPSPTEDEMVTATLKGIRRDDNAKNRQQKKAITIPMLKSMVDLYPQTSLRNLRNRAILLLAFAGAFRRNELVSLNVEDITFLEHKGMDIFIRKSKTDQERKGERKAILFGDNATYCPVVCLKDWLAAANITEGAIFRRIKKAGVFSPQPLSDEAIYNLVKKSACRAGFALADYSPHSLRAGFVTAAAENGASVAKIMEVTLHRSVQTLHHYIRHAERYKDHAGRGLL